jgi:UDPglucose 6-dehydrogenase
MRVTVIGTGYVGTVTGACLSYIGHHVTCVDTDAGKIAKLKRGESPIYEPYLEAIMALAKARGGLEFTTNVGPAAAASDVIFIAVGTPPQPNGEPNLEYLEAAARGIGAGIALSDDASRFRVVVNKSTVPVGSGNLVETLVREGLAEVASNGGRQDVHFGVASNPEFLREGSAVADSLYPDRIVVGASDAKTLTMMRELYAPVVNQSFDAPEGVPRPDFITSAPMVETSLTSAEMIKYAANAFLAMKIGFANEIANVCERVGAEGPEVMRGIGLDSRIGARFLNAGVGWGGSCFGKDVSALLHTAREYGYEAKLLAASLEVNAAQRMVAVQKLQEKLYILKGRTIAVLGLAFKPDTDDLRDAPSLHLIERLLQLGARVNAFDPIAMDACKAQNPALKIKYCDSALECAREADAVVVVTEWAEFRQLDLRTLAGVMTSPVLIDGRNIFNPDEALAAGFDYAGIGRRLRTPNAKREIAIS